METKHVLDHIDDTVYNVDEMGLIFSKEIERKDPNIWTEKRFFNPDVCAARDDDRPRRIWPDKYIKPMIPQYTMVFNQGGTGKCVAYSAILSAMILFYVILGVAKLKFSENFVFSNRKPDQMSYKLQPWEGMYIEDMLQNWVKDGICMGDLFPTKTVLGIPNNPDGYNVWDDKLLTPEMFADAAKYKLKMYYKTEDINEVMSAIMDPMKMVIMSIPVVRDMTGAHMTITWADVNSDRYRGQHAVAVPAFEYTSPVDLYMDYVNSWGGGWSTWGIGRIHTGSVMLSYYILCMEEKPHWAEIVFDYLWDRGYCFPTKDFDRKCTRGQAIEMLAITMGSISTDRTYFNYYDYCNNNAEALIGFKGKMITNPASDADFAKPITRGEVMALVSKMMGWQEEPTKPGEHWAEKFYRYLNAIGVTIHERRFNDQITRGEFMVFMAKFRGFRN